MRNHQAIWLDTDEHLTFDVCRNRDYDANVQVEIGEYRQRVIIAAQSPAELMRLARVLDQAAVLLSAELDVRAAAAINANSEHYDTVRDAIPTDVDYVSPADVA